MNPFIKKYKWWFVGAGVLLLFPALLTKLISVIMRPFASLANNVKDTGNSAVVDAQIKQNQGTYVFADGRSATVAELDSDARAIFKALGLDKAWYDPSSWTENESAVVGVCLKYTKPLFSLLASRYQAVNDRPLVSDLTEYLSTSDLNKINHLYV